MAKPGRKPVPPERQRKHPITCRVTDAELAIIDQRRGGMTRGEWLRTAALKKPPAIVPELNREAWAYLGKMGNGLTWLIGELKKPDRLNVKPEWFENARAMLKEIRAGLIGTK